MLAWLMLAWLLAGLSGCAAFSLSDYLTGRPAELRIHLIIEHKQGYCMGRADYYKHGDNNVICDRCGFKYKASQLKKEWNGLWTCPFDWEPRHPQDLIKSKHDDQRPSLSRPGAEDIFIPAVPFANAGIDQNVFVLDVVQLDGSLSQDTDGLPLTYLWTQISGLPVTLSSNTVSQPTFVAPIITISESVQFSLTVNNGGKSSQPDVVSITINPVPGAWDVANMVNAGAVSLLPPGGATDEQPYTCAIEAGGRYMFWRDLRGGNLRRATLSALWDVTSLDMGTLQTYNIGSLTGFAWKSDGMVMISTDDANSFREHVFTSPHDLNTGAPTGRSAPTGMVGVNATLGVHALPSGNRIYVGRFTNGDGNVYSYTMSNFDIDTIQLEAANILPALYAGQRTYQPYMRPDGGRMFLALVGYGSLDNIDMPIGFDLTSANIGNSFNTFAASLHGVFWKPDGTRVYLIEGGNLVNQYDVKL